MQPADATIAEARSLSYLLKGQAVHAALAALLVAVALVVALFQHGYIWVHFLVTEKPDMELTYGARAES